MPVVYFSFSLVYIKIGHPKTSFFPWEISPTQRLGRSKVSEKGWWCQVMSVVLLSLCFQFWSLLCVLWNTDVGDVFDHNYTKVIAKQNNDDSEDDWGVVDNDNPLYLLPSCSLFYILSYLSIWLHDRVNLCVLKKKKNKGFARYLTSLILDTYRYFTHISELKTTTQNCTIYTLNRKCHYFFTKHRNLSVSRRTIPARTC